MAWQLASKIEEEAMHPIWATEVPAALGDVGHEQWIEVFDGPDDVLREV